MADAHPSLLRSYFGVSVFAEGRAAEAADAYEAECDDDLATKSYNIATARSAGAQIMPSRDFILATARMRLDDDELVYVTTRWRRAAELTACGTSEEGPSLEEGGWVEQRSLRFGDPLDPPENVMVVGQPSVCQKPYMRVLFFAMGLLCQPPARILLIGLGAGQLVEIWRTHLPSPLHIDCVELHAEVVELARRHFNFGRADDAQTTTSVEVADGRAVLQRSPAAAYDIVVVDLSVAGFVDGTASADLRRVLKPGGLCINNYNFSGGLGTDSLGALPEHFVEVHRLVINAYNTILVSTTAPSVRADGKPGAAEFGQVVDAAVGYPFVRPLPFDLRSDLEAAAYDRVVAGNAGGQDVSVTNIAERCDPVMIRGRELLERVQVVGGLFTLKLRECSQLLTEMRNATPAEGGDKVQAAGRTVVVQQVMLRKVLAVDRGQAATLARSINAMLDGIADLADQKDGPRAQADTSAVEKLADYSGMLNTARTRLEKLEERATQLKDGVFEALLEQSDDDSSDEEKDTQRDAGGGGGGGGGGGQAAGTSSGSSCGRVDTVAPTPPTPEPQRESSGADSQGCVAAALLGVLLGALVWRSE